MDKLIVYEPIGQSNADVTVTFEVETFLRQVRIEIKTSRWLNVPVGTAFEIEVALRKAHKLRFSGVFTLYHSAGQTMQSRRQFTYIFVSQGAPNGAIPTMQYAAFVANGVAVS